MFRLIKLGMYALVGYALYELYQGFSSGEFQQRFGSHAQGGWAGSTSDAGGESQHLNRSFGQSGQNLTGAGEGMQQSTLDNDGGSVPHNVGRGVTI
jgi:hypothetical protein